MFEYEVVRIILNNVNVNHKNVNDMISLIRDIIQFSTENYNFQDFLENFNEEFQQSLEEECQFNLEYVDFDKSDDTQEYTLNIFGTPDEETEGFLIDVNINHKFY